MGKNRAAFFIKLGAFCLTFLVHSSAAILIYYGGSGSYYPFWQKQKNNMIYDDVEFFVEESSNLRWIETVEEDGAQTQEGEVAERYSYNDKQIMRDEELLGNTDSFIKIYESESDFLSEKINSEKEIFAYAQDILPQQVKTAQGKKKSNKKPISKGQPQNKKVSKGKTQSAYCRLPSVVSAQKPKKPARIKILVDKNGKVKKVTLMRSSGVRSFDKAVLRLGYGAKCRPEIKNGTRQNANVNIDVSA